MTHLRKHIVPVPDSWRSATDSLLRCQAAAEEASMWAAGQNSAKAANALQESALWARIAAKFLADAAKELAGNVASDSDTNTNPEDT